MNKIDLAFTPALEQAQLIKKGEVSPLELVEVYLERIQKLNPQLGSYFTVMAEAALADAKAKTEQLAVSQENLPPFFGVTISIKDLTSVAGVPCTYGTPVLMNQIASYDDGIVSKIKAAGFTILGKTATSELGSLPYTEQPGFPPARNPWNLEYTAGGSSGGAAASVAAGLSAIAQGSDGGGSIRGPANCCGVVGIKPSRGRVSYAPVGDRLSGISVNGPIAHTVADAAALLDVMSGYITGDPYWLADPNPSFLAATKQNPSTLNIAFSNTLLPVGEADSICQKPVLETVQLLAEMGHKVTEVSLDFSDLIEPFRLVWQSGVVAAGIPSAALDKINKWLAENSCTTGQYLQAVAQMQIIARRIVALFDNFDVLVLPVFMHPTIRVGEWAELSPEETLAKVINWVAPCPPFNASGQPSIAIPMGFNSATGLPLGVQLVGRPAAEATLISLAAQIEAAKPWIQHRPIL
ncbi:amidase [Phormidium sp. LEGE 05292]|uniref:amidase n=1 Tax=[Phormidium] sp. LEGE 05292 TaxID=767427 RepID=UPI001880B54C|nr:amidase [Phormidium sp. LEGE 05292]MBE9225801.1 amidase [Phormidium sp. LEGE 05292]